MVASGALFAVMVISPVWFFRKVDALLFQEEEKVLVVENISPLTIAKKISTEEELDIEIKKLELLQKAYDTASSQEAKRIWSNKKQQYINELKWRQLEEHASGKHTLFSY
jgi:DNA primase